MKRVAGAGILLCFACIALNGCGRKPPVSAMPQATGHGSALVESGGGNQVASAGSTLEQPLVVQVNDAQGNGVAGAPVLWQVPAGVVIEPASGVTDSSGQFTSAVTLGGMAGRYRLVATTRDAGGKSITLNVEEIALDYQQTLGRQLAEQYCVRCHDPESTPLRVSNFDNLDPKPHALNDGEALNRFSDADLAAVISHGGPALSKSPQMPPYGFTLDRNKVEALISYMRAIQAPPFHSRGLVYAKK